MTRQQLAQAIRLQQAGDLRQAEAAYRQILPPDPAATYAWCEEDVRAAHGLGCVLLRLGRRDEAVVWLEQATLRLPDSAAAHNDLGVALLDVGRVDQASEHFERATELKPDDATAHLNQGKALNLLGRLDEAEANLQEALRLRPDLAEAQFALGCLWLLKGELHRGWTKYIWRRKLPGFVSPPLTQPAWDGRPFPNETLLLFAEQGLGDTIQFIRYVPQVKERGGKVVVAGNPALVPLLTGFPGIDELISIADLASTQPAIDLHASLVDLPRIFGTSLATIPANVPYLSAQQPLREKWRQRLSARAGLKIGIAWQGNPAFRLDHFRSIPLAEFAPLAAVSGVCLVSLQKGPGTEQLAAAAGRFDVWDLGTELDEASGPFLDTAAVMMNLDLVITADTSIAHLAGALGVPVWVALSVARDWRWMLDREDSPWYPTMRLFRQTQLGQWDDVFQRMADELKRRSGGELPDPASAQQMTDELTPEAPAKDGFANAPARKTFAGASGFELAAAVRLHQAGELRRAEQAYRQLLAANAGDANAWHLLGVIALQEKRYDQAIESIQRAIRIAPREPMMHTNLGVAYKSQRRWEEAEASYRRALALRPTYAEAHYNLGRLFHEQGRRAEAIAAYRAALAHKPRYPEAANSLGQALRDERQLKEAVHVLRQALEMQPGLAEAHVNLGNVFRDQGKLSDAIASYEEALRHKPELADAHNNLGCVARQRRRLDEAVGHFRRAAALRPDFADAHVNLGLALRDLERFDEAAACFETAIRLEPMRAAAYDHLGKILQSQGQSERAQECFERAVLHDPRRFSAQYDLAKLLGMNQRKLAQAEACLRRALAVAPDHVGALDALATVLAGQGCWEESQQHYARAQELAPSDARKVKAALSLPMIPRSLEEMHEHHDRIYKNLAALRQEKLRIAEPGALGTVDFYLAYHGQNERGFRADLARLYLHACPELAYVAPHCRRPYQPPAARQRIKIGFLSTYLRNHTIGRLNAGLIQQLDRSIFHVTVIRRQKQDEPIARQIDASADQVLIAPSAGSIAAARRLIAQQELDVLFYPDIGMETWTNLIGYSRLAPVQCVTWGHPLTTGIPTIDYFISSADLETPLADEHYTERLVRLQNLAVYYERPRLPEPAKGRRQFGLPEGAHLYGCLQTLFKFHPEFDAIIGEVLRRDPQGLLVVTRGPRSKWCELLMERLRRTIPDVAGRIRFVPEQKHADFLCLSALCDVMLDPIHFGGGNTCYEALAFGVPVVTLPSPFLRCRIALALYRRMNLLDCVAADATQYVELAVRLAADAAYRDEMRRKILDRCGVLYENAEGVRQLEAFLIQAVREAGEVRGATSAFSGEANDQ